MGMHSLVTMYAKSAYNGDKIVRKLSRCEEALYVHYLCFKNRHEKEESFLEACSACSVVCVESSLP